MRTVQGGFKVLVYIYYKSYTLFGAQWSRETLNLCFSLAKPMFFNKTYPTSLIFLSETNVFHPWSLRSTPGASDPPLEPQIHPWRFRSTPGASDPPPGGSDTPRGLEIHPWSLRCTPGARSSPGASGLRKPPDT